MKTITAGELIKTLKQIPDNTNIYLSTDSEGNSFSTLNKPGSFGLDKKKRFLILYPWEEGLDYENLK